MKKVFISQPMNGISDNEILRTRGYIKSFLESCGYEVIDSYITDSDKDRIQLLGESISLMHDADYIYFVNGWENSARMSNREECCKFK